MKVVCINKSGWHKKKFMPVTTSFFWGLKKVTTQVITDMISNGPRYGDILEVQSTYNAPGVDCNEILLYYMFKEWPEEGYVARAFRPIDESEEAEAEEKIKELLKPEPHDTPK